MEKSIKSETVFEGRIMRVSVDDVVLDDGYRTTREIVHRPETVSVLALDQTEQVLLVEQYRYAAEVMSVEIPAGICEPGETLESSARRELREETGYDCDSLGLLSRYAPAIGYSTENMNIFIARNLRYAPLEADERAIRLIRVGFALLYDEIVQGRGRFRDAKSTIAILLARARGLA